MTQAVLSVLGILTLGFSYVFFKDTVKNKHTFSGASWVKLSAIGFIVNFFDTLGIGSFAPATAFFKIMKLVPDRLIPGTLNVSMTIPIVLEALIFLTAIKVEPITLISMLGSSTLRAVIGAGVVSKLPERKIQIGMGVALLIVALIFLAGLFNLMPVGGDEIGLTGKKLIIGVASNFILGALMTIGIGLYAPCMAMVYALGMSPRVAFPIMMGSCAFLMPAASIKFVQESAYDRKASLAITIAGSIGVLIAAYIVKTLPLTLLKWLVVLIILYTAITMLSSGLKYRTGE